MRARIGTTNSGQWVAASDCMTSLATSQTAALQPLHPPSSLRQSTEKPSFCLWGLATKKIPWLDAGPNHKFIARHNLGLRLPRSPEVGRRGNNWSR